jgi:hypothetical protein
MAIKLSLSSNPAVPNKEMLSLCQEIISKKEDFSKVGYMMVEPQYDCRIVHNTSGSNDVTRVVNQND